VNGLLRIVDLSSGQVLQITRFGPKFFPNDLAFSQDSRHLAIGFANQTVKILTVESLK
jgi:WD40 repeat protein